MVIKDFKLYTNDEDAEKYQDCYVLMADFDTKEVSTNCADPYDNCFIEFDDFIKFAKCIEERLKKNENQS